MDLVAMAEKRLLPDWLIRIGMRRLLAQRLKTEEARQDNLPPHKLVDELRQSPIAVETDKANEQHYELPPEYFQKVLGPRLKYSSGYWDADNNTLERSENLMLSMTCDRAQLKDGQRVLELGCGWGSLSLYMAESFPGSEFVAVSNSNSQREFITKKAKAMGISNLTVVTADMNEFEPEGSFDRVVSVEMFEHMKNYQYLMKKISSWLRTDGKLFVHIFTHCRFAYHFDDTGKSEDWMANHFFTGGTMPSDSLLLNFQQDLRIDKHWRVNGCHYSKTLEAWLKLQDEKESEILPVFESTYGDRRLAKIWIQRWRMFYMACSELFRYNEGREWIVSHYLFRKAD